MVSPVKSLRRKSYFGAMFDSCDGKVTRKRPFTPLLLGKLESQS